MDLINNSLKVLALSDKISAYVYSTQIRSRFKDIDLVIGCGDVEYYYLEFVISALDSPLFYVRGNHDRPIEISNIGQRTAPMGGYDLHRRVIQHRGLLLAGIEGSLRYRDGDFQYTQGEMWRHVFAMTPALLLNKVRHGRFLDIFVTHAPPSGIHDRPDLTHQGIRAFRWLIKTFQPSYHFHGHIHLYRPDDPRETLFEHTWVVNAYPFIEKALYINRGKDAGETSSDKPNQKPEWVIRGHQDGASR